MSSQIVAIKPDRITPNEHSKSAALNNETGGARFPLPNPHFGREDEQITTRVSG